MGCCLCPEPVEFTGGANIILDENILLQVKRGLIGESDIIFTSTNSLFLKRPLTLTTGMEIDSNVILYRKTYINGTGIITINANLYFHTILNIDFSVKTGDVDFALLSPILLNTLKDGECEVISECGVMGIEVENGIIILSIEE